MSFAPSTQHGLMHASMGPNKKHPAATTHHPLSRVDVHSSRRYELITHGTGTDKSRRRGRETLSPKPRLSRTATEPLSFTFSLSFPLSCTLPLNPSPSIFLLLPFFLSFLRMLGLPSWLTQAPNSHSSSLSFLVCFFLPLLTMFFCPLSLLLQSRSFPLAYSLSPSLTCTPTLGPTSFSSFRSLLFFSFPHFSLPQVLLLLSPSCFFHIFFSLSLSFFLVSLCHSHTSTHAKPSTAQKGEKLTPPRG